ncbi:Gamma-glutamyl cyclotransferase, AIG2-like [Shimia gijangensis]|uniref:Gamma-glutamyl cyclotransferase, AIG2-like n=1 Tax=Shimia gijangensis TaxID=1470563 RepID=A0A1M6GZB9_9RHOB|nr:gamma-glutamylcyclotransferase family protein [Shimia gijangensis]SHJ15277.1 Gamma-glutamyl cyclotransferase, AIG2-like [Shimia gijangensis]
MKRPYFFGYGSLVNQKTHDFEDAHPARLRGWRRIWRHTNLRPVAYLTAVPDPSAEIDGLIAHVPNDDWAALDYRERAYDRLPVCDQINHPKDDPISVAVYTVPHGKHGLPTEEHPVLLSYIDVVVQGYLRQFGEAGVADFFATTSGWSAPVLNDRENPIYPRHQRLSSDERQLVDDNLMRINVEFLNVPANDPKAWLGNPTEQK